MTHLFIFWLIVNRYLNRAEDQLQLHNIPLKIQQLKEQLHSLTPTRREIKLSSIDDLTTNLLINAEKKYRKFRTSEVDHSPNTAQAGLSWCFWKLLSKHKLRGKTVLDNYLLFQIKSIFQNFTQCK